MRKNKIYRIKEYEDPKRALSKNARVLEQERDLSSLKKLQSLATVLSIITVVGGIGGVLFHSMNILGGTGILVSVASLFLCLWKPAYCSLYGEEAYGAPMVSVEGPLFFSSLMLTFLATMLVNYVSYARLLGFSAVIAGTLAALLYIRCRVAQKNLEFVFIILLYSAFWGFSIIGACNTIFADPEPAEIVVGKITDKWTSHSRQSGDSYNISLKEHGEELEFSIDEEDFNKLSVGDRIPVYFYSGGLGIPFADIIRY